MLKPTIEEVRQFRSDVEQKMPTKINVPNAMWMMSKMQQCKWQKQFKLLKKKQLQNILGTRERCNRYFNKLGECQWSTRPSGDEFEEFASFDGIAVFEEFTELTSLIQY